MNSTKLKASAVLVSFFIGAVLSIILVTALVTITKSTTSLGAKENYRIARVEAQNGIEEGLAKYKENNDVVNITETIRGFSNQNNRKAYHDLTIKSSGISVGSNLDSTNWYSDSDLAREQDAFELDSDREFNINISPWFSLDITKRPQELIIFSSNSFEEKNGKISRESIAGKDISFKYELDKDGKEISSGSAKTDSNHQLKVDSIGQCNKGSECILKLSFDLPQGVHSYFKIKASSAEGLMASSNDEPGTTLIKSIGYYSGAKATLVYKISHLGKNLGLSEEGVYCESKCKVTGD